MSRAGLFDHGRCARGDAEAGVVGVPAAGFVAEAGAGERDDLVEDAAAQRGIEAGDPGVGESVEPAAQIGGERRETCEPFDRADGDAASLEELRVRVCAREEPWPACVRDAAD